MPLPVYLEPGGRIAFADPHAADADGLVAVGGDLSPQRLRAAYERGIFPWFDASVPPLWWSPDPRGVLPFEQLHVSRSLRRQLRRGEFELTWNRAFADVIRGCATARLDGTWILPEMIAAYLQLHRDGDAHSLEVWRDGALVGGIYGVQRGGLFAAESKFHTVTGASKVALVACVHTVYGAGIRLFDVQFTTPHLRSMGAVDWPRHRYLAAVADAAREPVDLRAPPIVTE